ARDVVRWVPSGISGHSLLECRAWVGDLPHVARGDGELARGRDVSGHRNAFLVRSRSAAGVTFAGSDRPVRARDETVAILLQFRQVFASSDYFTVAYIIN